MRAIVLVVLGSGLLVRHAGAQPAPTPSIAPAVAPEAPPTPTPTPATAPVPATPAIATTQADEPAPPADVTSAAPASVPSGGDTTASAPAPAGPLTFAGITISGSLDAYATLNPARGATNAAPNDLYVFETQANGASVSLAKIALERKAAPVGFRLDVGFGQTIDIVNATDTAAGMGHDIMRNLEQAYISWAATKSLTLKIGKMVTHHGMEVIESQSNWNYTHSLLFSYAIPFTQTGIAVDWVASDKLEATLFVVNGLNNTFEGNAFKSPGAQIIYKPTAEVTLIQNFSAFNEQPGDAGGLTRFDNAVYLFDTVAMYAPSAALELGLNSDIAYDATLPSDKILGGAAAYARWHANDKIALSGRTELFHDNSSPTLGLPLGMKGNIGEATATFSYAPSAGLLLRTEARVDRAFGDFKPFTDKAGTAMSSAQQATFILGAVAAF
ncbi:MAG TPA: outer membrane beta-barrel protein [Kofleriaceae bacterium]|nr:outer membrane beta-barrel protein [Kofleriaceae bacterium]